MSQFNILEIRIVDLIKILELIWPQILIILICFEWYGRVDFLESHRSSQKCLSNFPDMKSQLSSEINIFQKDELDSQSLNRIQFQRPHQNSAPSKNRGFQNSDSSDNMLIRGTNFRGLKRVNMTVNNYLTSIHETHGTSIEDDQVRTEWEQLKIKEISEALNLNDGYAFNTSRTDDCGVYRGCESEPRERDEGICQFRKIDVEMRSFQNINSKKEHAISQIRRMKQRNKIGNEMDVCRKQ